MSAIFTKHPKSPFLILLFSSILLLVLFVNPDSFLHNTKNSNKKATLRFLVCNLTICVDLWYNHKKSRILFAVGVVVGSAFTAIVNALVDNVLMPLVGAVIAGINFQDLGFHIPWGNHPYINIGAFLSAVITFLITAFCVFLIVKAVNTMRNLTFKKKEEEKKEEPEKVAPDIALLTEIRDLLKQQQNEETKR